MTNKEKDEALLALYKTAVTEEDNIQSVIPVLLDNPDFLRVLLEDWFRKSLTNYISLRACGTYSYIEDVLFFGKLVPEIFAKTVRQAFSQPDLELEKQLILDEEQIQKEQKWLQLTFPEIVEDIQSESASNEAMWESPVAKQKRRDSLNKILSQLGYLPHIE